MKSYRKISQKMNILLKTRRRFDEELKKENTVCFTKMSGSWGKEKWTEVP